MTRLSSNPEQSSHNHAEVGGQADKPLAPSTVRELMQVVECGARFATIYAHPPWPYSNTAAREASEIRGNLPFNDRTVGSWQLARRTAHSRKPFLFRGLIEQVSPGPYLELYGREERPNCGWTVFGNQVERKLF